jgi:hypothetical protein
MTTQKRKRTRLQTRRTRRKGSTSKNLWNCSSQKKTPTPHTIPAEQFIDKWKFGQHLL